MKPRLQFPLAFVVLLTGSALAQSSPYRGLWVGEASLSGVNEVTVPLDENNIPRAPDPEVTTPTSDLAKIRLILHVDASGQVSLLKHVAVLARKADGQISDTDLALVTDPRRYGDFPAQPAKRISSVAFDFGDPKATTAVNEIAERAATAATAAAQLNGATVASVTTAAQNAATTVLAEADAESAWSDFVNNHLTPAAVRGIAGGDSTDDLNTAGQELFESSFYQDERGIMVGDAILAAIAGMPNGTAEELAAREQVALNVAASFIELDLSYDRFLSSELFGDMIRSAGEAAAVASDTILPVEIDGFVSASAGSATGATSVGHGLENGDEVAVLGAAIQAYNGLHQISKIDDDTIQIDVPFVAGGAVGGYEASDKVGPTTVESPGHGLADGDRITLRDSDLVSFNGKHFVTVIDEDRFSIALPYESDPAVRGVWSIRSGSITDFSTVGDGTAGTLVNAPSHGLNNGEQIEILDCGDDYYNGLRTITRIDDDSFSIPLTFGTNPEVKGTWDVRRPIAAFRPPSVLPSLVVSTAHGLVSGDRIQITGSDQDTYNGEHLVTVVDADSFSIGVEFDALEGDPAVKGSWSPGAGGSWRDVSALRSTVNQQAKVVEARNEALNLQVESWDKRAPAAVEIVVDAILASAGVDGGILSTSGRYAAIEAGWDALAASVPRFPNPPTVPSLDYNGFVDSEDGVLAEGVATAAVAAAEAAVKESLNVIATPESIQRKSLAAATDAIVTTFSAASRALLTELPMTGSFGPGESGLQGRILLPANHPTNPFRHFRHPDHTRGFDVTRMIDLSFFQTDDQPLSGSNYGVDQISGLYEEEIFGLHKALGPNKDVGLKVAGSFQLQRISLIDTLNGR